MADKSSIEWTDATWNPVRGCTKVSAGCKNCYAERFAERFRGVKGHAFEQGFDLRLVPEALDLPLHWRRPRRVFVNSMSDLFHEAVPFDFVAKVLFRMAAARRHTFQVLTKRPERMREFFSTGIASTYARTALGGPLPNVWLGVSVEDQRAADERIPHLLATPAALRFLSCEPLLGPVDLSRWTWPLCWHWDGRFKSPKEALAAGAYAEQKPQALVADGRPFIRWVIIGGESGPGARPCDVAWIRSLVAQCKAAQVPAFVKQLGAQPRGTCSFRWTHDRGNHPAPEWLDEDGVLPSVSGRPAADLCHAFDDSWVPCKPHLRDRKGGEPSEWPADLQVRQMPEVRR